MIKINLVPVKEKKKRKEFLILFFVAVFFLVIALGMFWIYVQRIRVKSDLKREIGQIEEESKGYQEKINEIKDLENKEAGLEAFKKTIKGISGTQRNVIVGIDQLALALPAGVWLTSLSQGKGADSDKFVLAGYSFSQAGLRSYLETLQKPGGLLKDATLDVKNFSAAVGNNKQIQQFEITARVMELGS